MFEIFRMQLGQVIGGRMKWLVVLCLLLPVLLTLAAVGVGGLDELRREIEAERSRNTRYQGELPRTVQRVVWEGKDLAFARGRLVLTEDEILCRRRPVDVRMIYTVDDGYVIVRDGELWLDPSKERRRGHLEITRRILPGSSRHPEIEITVESVCAIYLFLLYPQVICLLLALFYGTSVLGHELNEKTLTYLFTRPLPRWRFVVGKYLGIVTALALPVSLSLLVSWLVMGAEGGISLLGTLLTAAVGALLAYNAIFVLCGFLVPRRAMIVALLYGLIFEFILSFVPALVNQVTVTYYLRSIVVNFLDLTVPAEISRIVGGASSAVAVAAVLAIIFVALTVSSVLAARKEYVVRDEA